MQFQSSPLPYFSDGSVIVSCEEAEGDNLRVHLVAAWVRGVTRYTKAVVPDGYSPAESSQLYGMFGKNYVRLFKRPDSDDVTFLAERYVRAVDDGCAAWMRTTEDPVYFLRPDCQAIAAVIMPVRDKTNSNPKLG